MFEGIVATVVNQVSKLNLDSGRIHFKLGNHTATTGNLEWRRCPQQHEAKKDGFCQDSTH